MSQATEQLTREQILAMPAGGEDVTTAIEGWANNPGADDGDGGITPSPAAVSTAQALIDQMRAASFPNPSVVAHDRSGGLAFEWHGVGDRANRECVVLDINSKGVPRFMLFRGGHFVSHVPAAQLFQ